MFVIFLVCLLLSSCLQAHFKHEGRLWDVVNLGKHYKKWSFLIHFEGRFRYKNEPFGENLNRVVIGYQVHPRIGVLLGYDFFIVTPPDTRTLYRQEVWEAVRFVLRDSERIAAAYQCSVQERTQFGASGLVWQSRQFLSGKFKAAISERVSPFIANDLFISFNKTEWQPITGISQNRLYVGLVIDVAADHLWEIGYMNRILVNKNTENLMEHIAYIGFVIRK